MGVKFNLEYHEKVVVPYRRSPFWTKEVQKLTEVVADDIENGWCLDVGCDDGALAEYVYVERRAARSDGIDVNVDAVMLGRKGRHPQVHLMTYAGHAIPVVSALYNVVFCMHTLGHVEHPLTTLIQIHRVLCNGGKLALLVPNRAYYEKLGDQSGDPTQKHQFDTESLMTLVASAGFVAMHMFQFGDRALNSQIQSRIILKATK